MVAPCFFSCRLNKNFYGGIHHNGFEINIETSYRTTTEIFSIDLEASKAGPARQCLAHNCNLLRLRTKLADIFPGGNAMQV